MKSSKVESKVEHFLEVFYQSCFTIFTSLIYKEIIFTDASHHLHTPVRAKSEAQVDLKSVEEVPGDKFEFAKPKGVGATLRG